MSIAATALAIVVVTALALAGTHAPSGHSPTPAESPALAVTANFGGWTWFGTGGPCEPGSNLTFVAHFFGNASGGTPPYMFLWTYGDPGSNRSTGQNVTHVFLTNNDGWNVDLNVTDSAGYERGTNLRVTPAAFSCPAEGVRQPNGNQTVVYVASGIAVVGVGVACVGVVLWSRRRAHP